jgi:hypothetical protein
METSTRSIWDKEGAPLHFPPNKTFYILRSPAPIRLWTYRALLGDNAVFQSWRHNSTIMDDDSELDEPAPKPYLTRLRLALGPYAIHFQTPGYIKDETMCMLERDVCKKTLEQTRRNFELRYALTLQTG